MLLWTVKNISSLFCNGYLHQSKFNARIIDSWLWYVLEQIFTTLTIMSEQLCSSVANQDKSTAGQMTGATKCLYHGSVFRCCHRRLEQANTRWLDVDKFMGIFTVIYRILAYCFNEPHVAKCRAILWYRLELIKAAMNIVLLFLFPQCRNAYLLLPDTSYLSFQGLLASVWVFDKQIW